MTTVTSDTSNILRIPLEQLTEEAFAPYGEVCTVGHPVHPSVDNDEYSVMLLELGGRQKKIGRLAFHTSYNQTFLPVRGAIALLVAPRPVNDTDPREDWIIDYGKVKAFLMEPGQIILIDRGIGHNTLSLGEHSLLVTVTKKHGDQATTIVEQAAGRNPSSITTIEYIDFGVRDDRFIELEL
jgi:ureidoglycolate hydrolase